MLSGGIAESLASRNVFKATLQPSCGYHCLPTCINPPFGGWPRPLVSDRPAAKFYTVETNVYAVE